MKERNFNIRVYALIFNNSKEVLLTDEFQLNTSMTKFPGGGLEYGEGTMECLRREIKEEMNGQEICNIKHFYTTDFFQRGLFYEQMQIISIYYTANLKDPVLFNTSTHPFDFELKNGNQSFRWCPIESLNEGDVSFPIDKKVVSMLKSLYQDIK